MNVISYLEMDITNVKVSDLPEDDYEAILILGGRAPEYLRHNQTLLSIVRDFNAAGKWIFLSANPAQHSV